MDLRGLAARVGVNFGIEDKNIDIIAGSEDVIQSAVTDIVSPAVTTKDPLGTFNEELFVVVDGLSLSLPLLFQLGAELRAFQRSRLPSPTSALAIQSSIAAFRSALTESNGFHFLSQAFTNGFDTEIHTQTIFSIVFEQGVSPGRTMTLMVLGVRHGRSGSTPNGGAARSVSNHHAVTIELGYQFSIRSFAAACAGTGELKQRLFELAALNGVFIHRVGLCRDLLDAIFPSIFQMFLGSKRHHDKGFFLSRASVYTVAAALAVHGGNHHAEVQVLSANSRF